MSPGMGVDKCVMSSHDLKNYDSKVFAWDPAQTAKSLFLDGFGAKVYNPVAKVEESLLDLICFGSKEVRIISTQELTI